ncbi:MAG: hypothetical protein JJE18_04640 [Eubacteriaceae bacterium]|nr:hypothetical protein [Eubacteriaceae bacterium]
MLDARQLKCIELKSIGMTVTDIAKTVGISRTTYYEWNQLEEVRAEACKLEQEFISSTRAAVVGYGPKAVSMLKNLAENADSEKIRLEATKTLLDKVISNAVKISIDDSRDDDSISADILDQELLEFDKE